MSARLTPIHPAALGAAPRLLSHGILAPAGSRILFVAGQVGWDRSRHLAPGGFVPQFERALDERRRVVECAGGTVRRPTAIHHLCHRQATSTEQLPGRRGGLQAGHRKALPGDGAGRGRGLLEPVRWSRSKRPRAAVAPVAPVVRWLRDDAGIRNGGRR